VNAKLFLLAVSITFVSCANSRGSSIKPALLDSGSSLPPGSGWQSVGEGRWIQTDGRGFFVHGLEAKKWMLQQLRDKLAVTTSKAVAEQLEMQIRALEDHIAELERITPR
jgi:hypothetical protein